MVSNFGLISIDTTTANTWTSNGGIMGGAFGQQIMWPNYNQQTLQNSYGQLALQNHFLGQAYGIVAELPEKVFKTAKGFLAELREEIDAWHGDILRS